MSENEKASSSDEVAEISRNRSHKRKIDELYIQNEIDKLNVDELVQPEQNNALKKVIKTDRKIVINLDDKITKLQKCCQYGKQVSKIINFKAEGLSTISLKEKLNFILDTFNENFSDKTNNNKLDFIKVSNYFSMNTFSYCSLNYDTIPLHLFMCNNDNSFNLELKEKKNYNRSKQVNKTYKKLKDYEYEKGPEIKLETYEQSMKLKDKLKELEKIKKHVHFINFIIDTDPINGYNETTFKLFLITLLISKGHVEFYKNENNILCIKSSNIFEQNNQQEEYIYDQNKNKQKKNQALLTSWSYDKWKKLATHIKDN
ncbi:hypothetical protein PGSY75_0509900 [Plasmodium gaboni]|uniref:Uncharacterized protein n=1 Tax=Plasmodium gaboni TaxID=647221 RepID=A0A151LSY8_9APIC|nr:hypothetical protein PGSY75_0509900 [Plasmodium gaboni]KYO02296.1 hypothetical protein PGSY75_0509900 [Plasmodium gaboni]SOV11828.1 conserved Plasmodium protein, unknown function [Plasmodium gaboni]SOV21305.1 conserved Plasmodium protein, unknown function [Plasmodium sp. DRC-Itaito]